MAVDDTPKTQARLTPTFFLALALILIGIGQMALLPPFEGFDERAHYSSIRQIADTGTIPILGKSHVAQEVDAYRALGPTPYNVRKPFEQNEGLTYPAFFADQEKVETYLKTYRTYAPRPPFANGADDNWQAQHPPLYYLLMAPVMMATDGLPFVTQFFVLRCFSFLLALAGFFIGLRGTLRYSDPSWRGAVTLAFFIYPVIVPQFFPEFGRLGNDSLCLLLMGAAWHLILRWLKDEFNQGLTFALGLTLALGLLTKAFFLPVAAGLGGLLLLRLWRGRENRKLSRDRFDALFVLFLPVLFASFWYVYKWKAYGAIDASWETALLAKQGEFWPNLEEKFTGAMFLWSVVCMVSSWAWAGTASLVTPRSFHLVFLLLNLWMFARYARFAKDRPWTHPVWLPLWLGGLLFAGLIHHILHMIAVDGRGQTPGWYMNILLPALAYAHASALLEPHSRLRRALPYFLILTAAFSIVIAWFQIALFTGCAVPDTHKFYAFPDATLCLNQTATILSRLDVIAFPHLGLVCAIAGIACYATALARTITKPVAKSPA